VAGACLPRHLPGPRTTEHMEMKEMKMRRLSLVVLLLLAIVMMDGASAFAGSGTPEVPADFPADVLLAEYMVCYSVSRVRDEFMITWHAKDKTVADIVAHFTTVMAENGWEVDHPLDTPTKAVLPYSKGDRRCGISIVGFVFDESFQKDESTCGITIQTPATGSSTVTPDAGTTVTGAGVAVGE